MSEKNDKWSMFTNYMTNELHITKDDIRGWIQEAIEIEVKKVINNSFSNCNLDTRISNEIVREIARNIYPIREVIAKEVASKFIITIKKSEGTK